MSCANISSFVENKKNFIRIEKTDVKYNWFFGQMNANDNDAIE